MTSLGNIMAVLETALCQHCGRHPFAGQFELAEAPHVGDRLPVLAQRFPVIPLARPDTDRERTDAVDDDERWLWQLVEEGDRTRVQAPSAPTPEEISASRRAVGAATATVRRVEAQVAAVEQALGQPSSWLRPGHRVALSASLRRGRAALIAATMTRDAAERAFVEMDRQGAQRRTYLATHQALLESAADARRELDRRVDNLIDAYAKSSEPPAWFRLGLGYPPRSDQYADWLERARTAIAYRRRHGIDHPLEPTGGSPA
jgi:hypothetical protein